MSIMQKIGIAPLRKSRTRTSIADFVPSILKAFVAPVDWLPCFRMSIPDFTFPIIKPTGMLPIR